MVNKFKELRTFSGLSQSKFSKYFGIPVRTYQRWEIEQAAPPVYVYDMMKRIMNIEKVIIQQEIP